MEMMIWYSWLLGGLPILGLVLWWWNELWYVVFSTKNGAKLPAGHMGFPLFGEMLSFLFYFKLLRRPDDFINSRRRKYGDGVGLYRSYLYGSPTIIVWCPLAFKYILQSEDSFVLEWPNVEVLGRKSLVVVHGKSHARMRSYVSNAINTPNSLARIAAEVQPRMVSALQSWALARRIKARHLIKKLQLTMQNIGRLFASLEEGHLLDELDKLFEGVVKGVRSQPSKIPGTACYHATQCRRKLEAIFVKEIEKRKNMIRNGGNDLLDGLMQIEDENGNQLSDKEVLDNIISLVVGGYESTALSSTWAIYYLAKYPRVLQKLREENMAMCAARKGEFITAKDVSQLKYTNKVVEETIRMANVAQFLFRSAKKDVEYKGYRIPKGWKVVLMGRYVHTDPDNYENPLCFNPDRWNNPAKPGTHQVFGGGIRICAGNMLARLQVALLLHHLSIGYKWELVNPDAKVSYLPHPVPVDGVEITFTELN